MNMSVRASCLLVAGGMLMAAPQMALGQTAFERLIETAKTEVANLGGVLDIALDWTDSDAGPVMEEFKLAFPFINTINYTRETGIGPFGQYLMMIQQGDPPLYDFMHVASEFEQQYMDSGAFIKPLFEYGELNDSLPADWPKLHPAAMDPSGYFLSTTGNARGNIWNPDLVPAGQEPDTWAACTDPKLRGQVVMDARNKLQAFQFDEGGERARHIQWLQDMKANDVVLIRGQGSIVRKIAAGEFPVACGINYHTAWRSIERDNVTTIKFTFVESVPLELGTRLYIPEMVAHTGHRAVVCAVGGDGRPERAGQIRLSRLYLERTGAQIRAGERQERGSVRRRLRLEVGRDQPGIPSPSGYSGRGQLEPDLHCFSRPGP